MKVHVGHWIIITEINSSKNSERKAEKYLSVKLTAKRCPLVCVCNQAEDCLQITEPVEDKGGAVA